jgi:superfamily II DNA/RNA helicase
MNYVTPTPIQERAIPLIVSGHDLIACAQTGTGKTAAFLLPLLNNLLSKPAQNENNNIRALIIVPTRELAIQIDQQLEGLSYFTSISSMCVYGGNDSNCWEQQKTGVLTGADVVVTTPGRLISHMNFNYVDLSHVEFLILDEADRMLEMGFIDDIKKIVEKLPHKRQTMMFSATMPDKIRSLAKSILHKPESINLATSKPAENILQAVYMAEDRQKSDIIRNLLKGKTMDNAIIFTGTKKAARELERELLGIGFKVRAIHSDLMQKDREEALREFKNGKLQMLVATDILSRGIDINGLSLVINYDVPHDPEDYIHRIGRTARADNTGVALTFVSRSDSKRFERIEEFLEKSIYKIPF